MYTVLIVDDEEPVLESYSFIIEHDADGFVLAGKARNGNEAVSKIYETKPDVVFMDINMPGLDGLDVISRVHDDFPHTVFILSTAYERFDIARRAIPLGIFSYLVKPVTRQVFLETLDQVAADLGKRKKADSGSVNMMIEQRFLRESVWKRLSFEQWKDYRRALALDSDEGMICFIGLDSDHQNFFGRINTEIDLKYRFIFAEYLNLGMYFFPAVRDSANLRQSIVRILESCVPSDVLTLTGFGSVRPWNELDCSCNEALQALQEKKTSTDIRLRERLRIVQIRRKMGFSDIEDVRAIFTEYWQEIFASYDFATAKGKMISLFTLLVDDATEFFQVYSDEAPPFLPSEEIALINDLSAWKDWALAAFNRLFYLSSQRRSGQVPVPLVRALAFMEEHFNRQIQLSDVAGYASVSPAYLSRLFSEHLGISFVEHLTGLRMARAERLIRENCMPVKEVAFAVGYPDPNYFGKAFKKTVGMSPSLYAERSRYEENCE